MEMKNHDFADHEKIDDDKSVEESESTEEVNKDVARGNTNRIHKTISEEGKKIILDYMKDWIKRGRKPSNPFKMLAKKLKDSCDYDYNSKAICDYYWNVLDPHLDHSPYSQEEKNYICEWASKCQDGDKPWKDLQPKMEKKFGKFRSRNSIKNVWNSNKRRTDRLAKEVKRNEDKIEDVTEKMNQLAFPINEVGPFTKQEKLELRYLLNDEDENDKNVDMNL